MTPHARRRRVAVSAALAAVGLVAAGCSTGTVSGQGIAVVTPAAGSSAPTSSADLSSSPSTSTTPSAQVESPTMSGSDVPTLDGVLVTDQAGHFRVRMPAKPERTTQPWSFGDYQFTLHVAVATSPYVAIVEGEEVRPALDTASFAPALHSVVNGFRHTSGMRLLRETATTFQGHTARTAQFERNGASFQLLAFVYSGTQLYVLLGPSGTRFDALTGSFEPLF